MEGKSSELRERVNVDYSMSNLQTFTQTDHAEGDQDLKSPDFGACLCTARRPVMLVTVCSMKLLSIINVKQ